VFQLAILVQDALVQTAKKFGLVSAVLALTFGTIPSEAAFFGWHFDCGFRFGLSRGGFFFRLLLLMESCGGLQLVCKRNCGKMFWDNMPN
jgi:hypothetical protein